jgi:hypothetical protein
VQWPRSNHRWGCRSRVIFSGYTRARVAPACARVRASPLHRSRDERREGLSKRVGRAQRDFPFQVRLERLGRRRFRRRTVSPGRARVQTSGDRRAGPGDPHLPWVPCSGQPIRLPDLGDTGKYRGLYGQVLVQKVERRWQSRPRHRPAGFSQLKESRPQSLTRPAARRILLVMLEANRTSIGAVCAVMTTVSFVLGIVLMASSGVQVRGGQRLLD